MKKSFFALVMALVMVVTSAVSVFAAEETFRDKAIAEIKAQLASYNIDASSMADVIDSLSDDDLRVLQANREELVAKADKAIADVQAAESKEAALAIAQQALADVNDILVQAGITVDKVAVEITADGFAVTATVKTETAEATPSIEVAATDEPTDTPADKPANNNPAGVQTGDSNAVLALICCAGVVLALAVGAVKSRSVA